MCQYFPTSHIWEYWASKASSLPQRILQEKLSLCHLNQKPYSKLNEGNCAKFASTWKCVLSLESRYFMQQRLRVRITRIPPSRPLQVNGHAIACWVSACTMSVADSNQARGLTYVHAQTHTNTYKSWDVNSPLPSSARRPPLGQLHWEDLVPLDFSYHYKEISG